jgi:LysM repeat protein
VRVEELLFEERGRKKLLLSTKLLKQRASAVLVAAGALAVLMVLAALPGAAEAQQEEGARNTHPIAQLATPVQAMPEPAGQVVVNPGDSLWSISQRQLGPNATAQQIATEVERTFELNRNRIGEDPNLILAGQELLLPPASEPAANEPATNTPAAGEAVATKPVADAQTNESAEPATSAGSLVASAVDTSTDVTALGLSERRLLGVGIIVLTLVVALLILWKAPLRRDVGSGAWRIMPAPEKYSTNHSASQSAPTATGAGRAAFALSWSENGSGGFGNGALTNGQITDDERRSWERARKPAERRRVRALRAKGGEKHVPLYAGVASALPASLWRKQGGREDACRSSPAARFYGHVALTEAAVGRRRKNLPRSRRSRASLSRRPLRKGWAAAVYSPQVRRSLEHAIRTETQRAQGLDEEEKR